MNSDLYLRFFSISRMSSARTDLVMSQWKDKGGDIGDRQLEGLAIAGREAAARAAEVEAQYRLQNESRGDGAAAAVDKQMDAAIVGLFDGLVGERDYLLKAGDARAADYDRFIQVHFEGQVSTVTRAPYEDELQRVERLYADATGPFAQRIAEAGVRRWIERVAEHLGPYREALRARGRVTRGDLDSARREMHLQTCAVVGHICAAYLGQPEAVVELLAPLVDQQDRIAAIMRARRNGVQTGTVDGDLDDLIEGDGEAPQPEGAGDGEAAEGDGEAADAAGAAPDEGSSSEGSSGGSGSRVGPIPGRSSGSSEG